MRLCQYRHVAPALAEELWRRSRLLLPWRLPDETCNVLLRRLAMPLIRHCFDQGSILKVLLVDWRL